MTMNQLISAQCIVALPPSANQLYGRNSRGVYRRVAYVQWLEDEEWKVRQDMSRLRPQIYGAVDVSLCVRLAKNRDIDNVVKPAIDLLERGGAVANDREITSVYCTRRYESNQPLNTIRIHVWWTALERHER